MYQVRCDDNIIYDLRDENLKIISPKLSTEVNKTGTFDFTVPPQNPCYGLIKKLKSIITIYQDDEEIWRGRVLNDKLDFYNRKQVECEGELSFLLDSIQRPYTFQGSPNNLFNQFIENHNTQVEEAKQFIARNINVPDNNNYINRENSNYSNTWDATNDKLINTNRRIFRDRTIRKWEKIYRLYFRIHTCKFANYPIRRKFATHNTICKTEKM